MARMKPFYITTPIFYPNAKLHMGHAYVVTICDILARYHKHKGEEVYFLTGSDENTGKILKNISGEDIAKYLDNLSLNFKDLYKKLEISYDQFIRTSDKEKHWPGAIAVWQKLVESGDIYKSKYSGLYCVECENFYTDKDLIDGKCPVHGIEPQQIEEENYFFKLSKYTEAIKNKIESNELKIIPETRKNEILALLGRGLEDVSFSRPKKVVPHGIPVPGDDSQVIYVWCDALVNYISALGYGTSSWGKREQGELSKFWPADLHVIGKDILRFHAAIWPAMLISAELPLPKSILVHGMITSGGKKMSKSLGNVIDPSDLIKEYGAEAVRYYLARHISPFEDSDLTLESFKEAYNANLANGLGNLVSRIMKMAQGLNYELRIMNYEKEIPEEYKNTLESFNLQKAVDFVWQKIAEADKKIQETQPFKLVKSDNEVKRKEGNIIIEELVNDLNVISHLLEPFLPETSEKIKSLIKENKISKTPLFARKD